LVSNFPPSFRAATGQFQFGSTRERTAFVRVAVMEGLAKFFDFSAVPLHFLLKRLDKSSIKHGRIGYSGIMRRHNLHELKGETFSSSLI
jgi:hypothetical protein